MKTKLIAILAVTLFAGLALAPQDSYELRLKFQKDDKYTESFKVKMKMGIPMAGDMDMKMEFEIATSVNSVEKDGAGNIEQEFKSMKMSGDAMGQKFDFDSTKKEDPDDINPVARAMKQAWDELSKQKIASKVDSLGKYSYEKNTKVGGMDLSTMQFPFLLPKGKIKVGEKWDSDYTMNFNNFSNIKAKAHYKLEKTEDLNREKCAVIKIEKVEMMFDDKEGPFKGMKITSEVKSDAKCYLNLKKGAVVKIAGTMNINMKMTIPNTEEEMKISMAMDLDYTRK